MRGWSPIGYPSDEELDELEEQYLASLDDLDDDDGEDEDPNLPCPECAGKGWIWGPLQDMEACPVCNGTGEMGGEG